MKTLIVSPTYNESKNIAELLWKVNEINHEYHILVVDDNSPDGTGDIVEELQHRLYPNVHLLRRPGKAGLGTAYKFGFKWALEGDYDIIVQMDADHSHSPSEIIEMIEKITDYDFIIASRHVPGSSIVGWGSGRRLIHSVAGVIAKMSAKIDIEDSTSGFRMFKRNTLQGLEFDKIKSDGFAFQIEVLYQLKQKGFRGLEILTRFVNRKHGKSKMGTSEMLQFINMCMSYIGKK